MREQNIDSKTLTANSRTHKSENHYDKHHNRDSFEEIANPFQANVQACRSREGQAFTIQCRQIEAIKEVSGCGWITWD